MEKHYILRISKCSLVVALLAAMFLPGCRSTEPQEPAGFERTVVDDLGKEVSLPAKVYRAVSLAPNLTEIVFAIGAGETLAGVTTFCNFPPDARNIRKVGDTLKPNIESIVALRPQVVFVSTASQLETFAGVLDRQGIKVFVTNPDSLQDVYGSIEKIGEVLGRKDEASQLIRKMRSRIDSVRQGAAGSKPVTVFVQIDKSLYTVGRDSYITDLIEIAGGTSVTGDLKTAYPKISRENARTLDPEVIILSESEDNDVPSDVFATSRAIRNGRVFRIDADVLSRPGPRIADAVEQIARALRGVKE